MVYLGDITLGDTLDFKFSTTDASDTPITMAGTPQVSAYPGNSLTESATGITLTVDFDSRTGLHNVRVVASSGNGYAAGTNYALVVTSGTVDGVSIVGRVIGHFSIQNRYVGGGGSDPWATALPGAYASGTAGNIVGNRLDAAVTSRLAPTVAARTLDVSAGGEAGVDWANVGSPTTAVGLSGTTIATSQVVASVAGAVGSVTGAVGSVTGNVGGNVTGSVGSVVAAVTLTNPQGIKKNTAYAGFQFVMAATGLTVTLQRSIDGAAFAATTNSPTEIGSKAYKLDLSAADLNGNTILFKASASGQPDAFFSIVTRVP